MENETVFAPDERAYDRFTFRYALLPAYSILLFAIVNTFSLQLGALFFAIDVLIIGFWLVVRIVSLIKMIWKRFWKRSVSILASIACVYPIFWVSMWLADYIHLAAAYSFYVSNINEAIKTSQSVGFDWGRDVFVGPGYSERTLVYDPADKLEAEVGGRNLPGENTWKSVRHLIGHFYVVQINYH